MKRLLLLVLLLPLFASAQIPPGYTGINQRYKWLAGMMDSGFHVPRYANPPSVRGGVFNGAGNVGVDTVHHKFYFYSGGSWREAGGTVNEVDTIYRTPGKDSIQFKIAGRYHAIKDSSGVASIPTFEQTLIAGSRITNNRNIHGSTSNTMTWDSLGINVRYTDNILFQSADPYKSIFKYQGDGWHVIPDYLNDKGTSFTVGVTTVDTVPFVGIDVTKDLVDFIIAGSLFKAEHSLGFQIIAAKNDVIKSYGDLNFQNPTIFNDTIKAKGLVGLYDASNNNYNTLYAGDGVVGITYDFSGFSAEFDGNELSASRTFTFPDVSGRLALRPTDSIGSPINSIYQGLDGLFHKAAPGLSSTLTNGKFYVGNGSNVATAVTPTGDVTFDNAGVFTIGSGKVVNSMIANSTLNLTTKVTGVLPIANGGTNNGSLPVTAGTIYYGDGTKLVGLGTGTVGQSLHPDGSGGYVWKDTTGANITGSGSSNNVAYFSGTNAITGSSSFTYDGTKINFTPSGNPGMSINGNSTTAGISLYVNSTTVTSGYGIRSAITGSDALTGQTAIEGFLSGTNSTSGQTTNGIKGVNNHGGTGAVNNGGYFTATNGATNNALYADNGDVLLNQTTGSTTIGKAGTLTGQLKISGSTSGTAILTVANAAGTPTITLPTVTGTLATLANTETLSNKRWVARVGSTTSSGTPTINTDNVDVYKITALAANITSMTTNLSGTPNDGDILVIEITGTATRTISWGSSFVSTSVALPTTTSSTTTLTTVLRYSTTSSYGNNKWGCVNTY